MGSSGAGHRRGRYRNWCQGLLHDDDDGVHGFNQSRYRLPAPPYGAVVDISPRDPQREVFIGYGEFHPRYNTSASAAAAAAVLSSCEDQGMARSTGSSSSSTSAATTTTASLAPGSLPGYTGWYRPPSKVAPFYRPIYFGQSNPSSPGTISHLISDDVVLEYTCATGSDGGRSASASASASALSSWSMIVYCPICTPGMNPKFYARAYGPAIVAGRVRRIDSILSRIPTDDEHCQKYAAAAASSSSAGSGAAGMNPHAYEISFPLRREGIYTVEVVLEQGDAWPLSSFPRSEDMLTIPEPSYEGWMIPGFPKLVQVTGTSATPGDVAQHDASALPRSSGGPNRWCGMDELTRIDDPTAQWVVTDQSNRGDIALSSPIGGDSSQEEYSNFKTFDRYKTGLGSTGICTDYVVEDCQLIPSRLLVPQDGSNTNVLEQCLVQHQISDTTASLSSSGVGVPSAAKPLNIIILGDSVGRLNTRALVDALGIHAKHNATNEKVYVSFRGELFHGVKYAMPRVRSVLNGFLERDERRVVFFNTGLHDIDDACYKLIPPDKDKASVGTGSLFSRPKVAKVSPSEAERNFDDITNRRHSGDCLEFFKEGFTELVDFIGQYPADLKVFRTSNAGWMRWGNFGFQWKAENNQQFIHSHHSVKEFNDIALGIIQKSKHRDAIQILDFFWPTLARPDHTDVDGEESPAGAHLVHPGFLVMKLLIRMQVMMILRTYCSSYLDTLGAR